MKYFLQKRIQNPIKHLRWRVKRAIIDVWQRSKYASDLPLIFKKYLVQTNSNLYKAPRSYLPSLQFSAAGLFKYVWPFNGHKTLKG